MPYTQVCPECGFKSETDQDVCPSCGTKKEMSIDGSTASDIIYNEIDSKIGFIEKPSIYAKIIMSLMILFAGIFLLPDFLAKSETFWLIYVTSNIFTIIKTADKHFHSLHGIYYSSLILLCIYVGAGVGNVISHAGKTASIPFNYYFNPSFITAQLGSGNSFIVIGAASGAAFFFFFRFILGILKE
jgi:hypothetical protein